ncbi:hypothetical protein BV372_07120 [Nostoc sp. T09]|uniref:hypothetical protein n=1 Tax=Nostoc sp. T09 TaxID=1932621 RepID=UPI000A36574C|nr:hypothetical protein [Nostoc sp. T09]OUL36530.1 hypothetical protein BV372_07120 [Nostoc sp. T09]
MNEQSYIIYLQTLSELDVKEEISDKISKTLQQILNTEEASSAMTTTNAFDWYVENFELEDEINIDEYQCTVTVNYQASGEQDEESGICGYEITGTAEAVIDEFGEVTYQNVTADIVGIDGSDDYDHDYEENLTEDDGNEDEIENEDSVDVIVYDEEPF